ncbi:thioredoxin-like protein [Amylocarpus encephaloides]|uniref:Glutathione S-transferase kappa n=1 Tax=Amylocarpus encephaloides TaxID=45428 RepID=A0A9P7YF28_9HELO|nr:thioredoxin-like protein [Amylocarpus encephaloides]
MARKLALYVDTVSPFAYEAYYILRCDPIFKDVDITYIPIFLGGVMKACGNTPPIKIKNKDVWINKTRLRWSKLFAIPMLEKTPPDFPPLTLLAMRALCALTVLKPGNEGQEALVKCLDKLYPAYWVEGRKTYEKDVLAEVLSGILGKEGANKVMEAAGKEGKERLGENTDQALADGAFGLPWFVVENEKGVKDTFWGVDHLGLLLSHLGIDKPVGRGWEALL